MAGGNRYTAYTKGAFERHIIKWAFANKGGTAENTDLRPLQGQRSFFIIIEAA